MSPIDSEDECLLATQDPDVPFLVARNPEGHLRQTSADGRSQHAYERHDVLGFAATVKWNAVFEREYLACIARDDVRLERKMSQQRGAELLLRSGFANDEETSRTHVDDVVTRKLFRDEGRPKSAMAADVGATHENDNRHVYAAGTADGRTFVPMTSSQNVIASSEKSRGCEIVKTVSWYCGAKSPAKLKAR